MTKDQLIKLKNILPRGYRKTLSDRTKLSVSLVDLVFAGKRQNDQILSVAIEMAESNKKMKEQLSQKIDEL